MLIFFLNNEILLDKNIRILNFIFSLNLILIKINKSVNYDTFILNF